jgi:competence protein ComEC
MRRPFPALALGLAAGAALPFPGVPLPAAAAAALLALSPPLAPLAFGVVGSAVAAAARAAPARPPQPALAPAVVEGRVVSVPERFEGQVRFTVRPPQGDLLLATTPDLPWPIALGDRLRMQARLRAPEGRRNPRGRDRAEELRARGIALEAYASAPPVRIGPPSPLARLELGRARFAAAAGAALPAREAALVRAIGTGDRGGVDAATAEAFARSGLAHLLSVSGLHLAVVAWGAYRLACAVLVRLDRGRGDARRTAALLTLPLTALYALGTGADVPVVRSALAAALAFGAVLFDREPDALNGIGLAMVAVLAASPGALLDPSFQLSFASVAGLALLSGPLRRALPLAADRASWRGRARELVLASACASTAATLATAAIVAFHFRRLSIVAVVSNLVGVPLGSALTIVSALAAAAVALGLGPGAAAPFLAATRPLAGALLRVNDLCAGPTWAAIGVGSPGLAGCAVFYLGLAGAWRLRGVARAAAAALAVAGLLAPAPLRHALAVRRGGLEVTFLAVGQGDATALLLPDGSAVLVDGGGEAQGHGDPGSRDVVPFLRDAGVRRLAAVFLSHPHPDHLLGLVAVAREFPIERLYANGRKGDEAAAAALATLPVPRPLGAGDRFERAGVRFEVLGPPPGSEPWSENDASLVLRVVYGDVAFLLCGDVEAEGEAALLASGADLRADVVKLPHHGSSTSSSGPLVTAARARYAVATAGRDNRFGFPSPEVVARWRAAGADVLRTGDGAVRFLSDGRAIQRTAATASLDALALWRERH